MSTLKNKLLGLFLLVLAAFIAVTNLKKQPTASKKNSADLVVKTTSKSKTSKKKEISQPEPEPEPETVTVRFGLNANFGPKPTTEQ